MKVKWCGYLILAAFFAGIIIANLWGSELLVTYGIFNTYFLNQFASANINYDKLLYEILCIRGKEIAALLILEHFWTAKGVLLLSECLLGVSFGILLVVAIANFGAVGPVSVFCGVFPQWLFYLSGGLLFFFMQIRKEDGRQGKAGEMVAGYLLCLLLFILGILAEVYINPVLCQQILRKC